MENLIKKYKYSQGIRIYSNKHYFKDGNTIHENINNNEDVKSKYDAVSIVIDRYNKIYPLHRDDIIELEKTLGRYQIAISKVLTNYYNTSCNFNYTAEQFEGLIEDIFIFDSKIADIKMRLACQD